MKIKELLSDETKWMQNGWATDSSGNSVNSTSKKARRWCLYGAVIACYGHGDWGFEKMNPVLFKIRRALGKSIVAWNDDRERTFDDVRQLVEKLDI